MNDVNKTFILMISLTVFFVIINFFIIKKEPRQQPIEKNEEIKENKEIVKTDGDIKSRFIQSGDFEWIEIPQEKSYDLVYENDQLKAVFDQNDALIKNLYIKPTFLKETNDKQYDIVRSDRNFNGACQLRFGSWKNNITLANLTGGKDVYHYKREGNNFIFTCKIRKKESDLELTIIKKYTFIDNENLFRLDIELFNNKNESISFDNSDFTYSLGWGPSIGDLNVLNSKRRATYDVIKYLSDGKPRKVTTHEKGFLFFRGKKIPFQTIEKKTNDSWLAVDSQYFTALMLPDDNDYRYFTDYRNSEHEKYYAGFSRETNKSKDFSTFHIYVGPKIRNILTKYDTFSDFQLEDSQISRVDEDILWGLGNKVIGAFLNQIYNFVGNYGVAIILLTLLIKMVTFPLTYKSMASQENMGKIQPKIKELQEKYKNDPQLLNKKSMELYKKEGINPLGGCLPMLLQMPILIAMYQLLDRMVQLKGASFLWIHDLSMPDAVLKFPFEVPLLGISTLNLLPIIMVGFQMLSSLFMPDVQSNKQAKMMMWALPLIFFFLFYNVSSGLVLYWTIMNILNLVQQVVTRKLKQSRVGKNK